MADHNDSVNVLDYTAPDGSYHEKVLDYLSEVIVNTGGSSNGGVVNKFGFNADIDSAQAEVIASFGGTFNIMTTADTLDVVSDDINDTSGGAGARMILIAGIDENFLAIEEYVTMNGS